MEIHSIARFLPYFENIRKRTQRVVDVIPPEHVEWTHQEGKFTLGDLVRHIAATERYMFAENVSGHESRYPGHARELADGYDNVMRYLAEMHAESMEMFGRLSDDDLLAKCSTPGGVAITTWKWLRSMVEHEVHHRGQIYLMLGILGVETPPLYGLTSEQVYQRSLHE